MAKKISQNKSKDYLIVAGIVIFACIVGYYYSNTNISPNKHGEKIAITNFRDCLAAGYPVDEFAPRRCRTPDGRSFVEDLMQAPPVTRPVTIYGEIACLPKTGSGEQTLECATGLKAADGKYYGLKNVYKLDPDYHFSANGMRVVVEGTFSQTEMTGPDGNKYDTAGDIDVSSIREDSSAVPPQY